MKKIELTPEEEKIAEDPIGFYGVTGLEAVQARRGISDQAPATERLVFARALLARGEPGSQFVALRAMSAAIVRLNELES